MTNYKLSQMPIPAAVPTIPAVCARQSYYALPPGHGGDKEGGRELVQLGKPPAQDASPLPLTEQHGLPVSSPPLFLDLGPLPPACSCCTARTKHLLYFIQGWA